MRPFILIVIAFLTVSATKTLHDSVSATFNVIEKGHVLLLEIDFDEENYIKFGNATSLKISKEDLESYLQKTTRWTVDGKEIIPEILTIKSEREHTKVICFLLEIKNNIKRIKVKNEFLIDVKDHSNIIKLDINNSFKDFRLHKNRRDLEVNYTKTN